MAITETSTFVGDMLHPRDVTYHMMVGKFINNLTRLQRQEFAKIISKTVELNASIIATDKSTPYLMSRLPVTPQIIDSVYVRGKYSLYQNVPCPTVTVLDNHGYVSLIDCVSHLLSFSDRYTAYTATYSSPILSSTVQRITDCTSVKAIAERAHAAYGEEPVVALYLTEWSDDFDPNVSTKSNRQSCWIKTLTIWSCNLEDVMDKMSAKFPIAVGKKGSSHEAVEMAFEDELKRLQSGTCLFFNKSSNTEVPVYLELLVSLQDQPERRSTNHLMLGGGKYSARWGFSCNAGEATNVLPTCEACLSKHDEISFEGIVDFDIAPECTECTNWEYTSHPDLMKSLPPNKYPRDGPLYSNEYILPFELNYSELQRAVQRAHDELVQHRWTLDEAKSYLWVFGINFEAVTMILQHATNARIYDYAERHKDTMPNEYGSTKRHKDRYPEKYNRWPYPAAWTRGISLQQHVDVPMHLIFMGVTKTTVKKILDWTKLQNKHTHLLRMSNGVLEAVGKLHLNW